MLSRGWVEFQWRQVEVCEQLSYPISLSIELLLVSSSVNDCNLRHRLLQVSSSRASDNWNPCSPPK